MQAGYWGAQNTNEKNNVASLFAFLFMHGVMEITQINLICKKNTAEIAPLLVIGLIFLTGNSISPNTRCGVLLAAAPVDS